MVLDFVAEFVMGRVCQGPSLSRAEFVMGRDAPESGASCLGEIRLWGVLSVIRWFWA